MNWKIERLTDKHDCRRFRSGGHTLDNFLKRHALENDRQGLGSTYVAVAEETGQVIGYVTLCSNSVHFENLPTEDLPTIRFRLSWLHVWRWTGPPKAWEWVPALC